MGVSLEGAWEFAWVVEGRNFQHFEPDQDNTRAGKFIVSAFSLYQKFLLDYEQGFPEGGCALFFGAKNCLK